MQNSAKTKGSWQREITKRSVLTSDDLRNHGIQSPDGIIQTLKEEGYLTEAGRVTNKLLTTTSVNFSTTLKDKIKINECREARNTVLYITQQVFDSQIAREELVTISQELKQKNFDFKICEIPTREPELSFDLSTLHL